MEDGTMKYIVIDTNIFVQDFWTQSSDFKILFSNSIKLDFKIILPQVIYDEILSQYGKKYTEYSSKMESSLIPFNKLMTKDFKILLDYNFDEIINLYKKNLDEIILEHNISIIDYPETNHKKIAKRSMNRTKPFKNNGEGYCDTLIWENILKLLQDKECEHLYFISNNPKDFFENENIAKVLIEDLVKLGIDANKISAYLSLQSFVKDEIITYKERLDSIKITFKNEVTKYFESSVEQWIEDNIFDAIDPKEVAKIIVDFPLDSCRYELSEVLTPNNIDIVETRLLNENEKYIVLTFNIEIGMHICTTIENFNNNKDIELLFTQYDSQLPYDDYDCILVYVTSKMKTSVYVENNDYKNALFTALSYEAIKFLG
jgi:predicted nucleic acid-binding protein